MMMLIGAAVRDHRQFPPDGDVFDIHREVRQHLAFSVGTHYCLGSALARLEGRIALEEILQALPRMGRRHCQCVTVADVNRPWLGFHAGRAQVKSVPLTTN